MRTFFDAKLQNLETYRLKRYKLTQRFQFSTIKSFGSLQKKFNGLHLNWDALCVKCKIALYFVSRRIMKYCSIKL